MTAVDALKHLDLWMNNDQTQVNSGAVVSVAADDTDRKAEATIAGMRRLQALEPAVMHSPTTLGLSFVLLSIAAITILVAGFYVLRGFLKRRKSNVSETDDHDVDPDLEEP